MVTPYVAQVRLLKRRTGTGNLEWFLSGLTVLFGVFGVVCFALFGVFWNVFSWSVSSLEWVFGVFCF